MEGRYYNVAVSINQEQLRRLELKAEEFLNAETDKKRFETAVNILGYTPTNLELLVIEDKAKEITGRWFTDDDLRDALENSKIFSGNVTLANTRRNGDVSWRTNNKES